MLYLLDAVETFTENELRFYLAEIILALEHLHNVSTMTHILMSCIIKQCET
jgi:hypothetical protein